MATPAITIDQVPDPSTWVPLKSKSNHPSSSRWTAIYQAEIKQQHQELFKNFSRIFSSSDTNDHLKRLVVVKQVSPHLNRPPHDTLTEIQTLARLHHPNVVPVLGHLEPPTHSYYCLFLPLYPATLYDLLNDQEKYLSPSKYVGFDVLVNRITRDIGSALGFLHAQSIAHRDINPSNVALTQRAHAVLIDFGTVWPGHPLPDSNTLEFELGTMPYRAPELLFGSRSYSPFAIDIWSFGTLIADCYTSMEPLKPEGLTPPGSDNNDESDSGNVFDWYCSGNLSSKSKSNVTGDVNKNPTIPLIRKTLFEGSLGDIGLVGSIFKVLGTPNSTTWPEAKSLPDFSKLNFHNFEKQNLENVLPYLNYKLESLEKDYNQKLETSGNSSHHFQDEKEIENLQHQIKLEKIHISQKVDLIESFLTYNSSTRLDSFKKIFGGNQTDDHHNNHPQSSCGWLFTSIQDEDQICFDSMKMFL